jgi:hypothetical protein
LQQYNKLNTDSKAAFQTEGIEDTGDRILKPFFAPACEKNKSLANVVQAQSFCLAPV